MYAPSSGVVREKEMTVGVAAVDPRSVGEIDNELFWPFRASFTLFCLGFDDDVPGN